MEIQIPHEGPIPEYPEERKNLLKEMLSVPHIQSYISPTREDKEGIYKPPIKSFYYHISPVPAMCGMFLLNSFSLSYGTYKDRFKYYYDHVVYISKRGDIKEEDRKKILDIISRAGNYIEDPYNSLRSADDSVTLTDNQATWLARKITEYLKNNFCRSQYILTDNLQSYRNTPGSVSYMIRYFPGMVIGGPMTVNRNTSRGCIQTYIWIPSWATVQKNTSGMHNAFVRVNGNLDFTERNYVSDKETLDHFDEDKTSFLIPKK